MLSPFPGMDPYLEVPGLWPDVHNALIAALRDHLGPALRPRYYVRIEERTYLSDLEGLAFVGRPDLSVSASPAPAAAAPAGARGLPRATAVEVPVPDRVRETWLKVVDARDREVVTVLELLSHSNKRSGRGRRLYRKKRLEVLGALTHLVEIDLLRAGEPMTVYGGGAPGGDYRILTSRGDTRPRAELLRFGVREAIPVFPLPLRAGDAEPAVDLGRILAGLYERAGYDLSIDYKAEPAPPLAEEDRVWADEWLRRAGLR